MDFEVCDAVKRALQNRQQHALYGYPVVDDLFFESIIGWHKCRYGCDVKREWIVPLNGVVSAIFATIEMLTGLDDAVMLFSPVYGPFFSVPRATLRKVVEVPLVLGDDCSIDFELLECSLSANRPKVLIFCHPHNPIGRAWKAFELERLAKLCAQYGCRVISDEIHSDIYFDGVRHHPFYALDYDGGISLFAPTKSFNLPGLNVAYAIIKDTQTRDSFYKLASAMHITLPNIFGIEALKAAYNGGEEWLDGLLALLADNRAFVKEFFTDKSYAKFYNPEATYLGWIDFAPSGLSDSQIRHKLLDEAKVGLSGGDFFFGGKSTSFHRINFATSRDNLQSGLDKIDLAFANLD